MGKLQTIVNGDCEHLLFDWILLNQFHILTVHKHKLDMFMVSSWLTYDTSILRAIPTMKLVYPSQLWSLPEDRN